MVKQKGAPTPFKTVLKLKQSLQNNETLKKEVEELREQLQRCKSPVCQEETRQLLPQKQKEQEELEELREKLKQMEMQLELRQEEVQMTNTPNHREEKLNQSLRAELRQLREQQEETSRSNKEALTLMTEDLKELEKELQKELKKLRDDHFAKHLQTRHSQLVGLHRISLQGIKLLMVKGVREEEAYQLRELLQDLKEETDEELRGLKEAGRELKEEQKELREELKELREEKKRLELGMEEGNA